MTDEILSIVKSLPEWFTSEALKNIKSDLEKDSLIIEQNGFVTGFIIYSVNKGKCLIKWMAVKKDNQKKGIGKRLIQKLIDYCQKNEIKEIETDTLAETEDYFPYELTRKFYHSVGFKDIEIIKEGYPEGSDKLILRLSLSKRKDGEGE